MTVASHTAAGRPSRWAITTADGVRLDGAAAGRGATTVLLLHGAASNRRWWDAVAGILARDHRVVWWDHRGHGSSGAAEGACSVQQLAEDTAMVMDALEIDRAVVAGHSAGAAVALHAAAHACPERVAAVVCVEGGIYDLRRHFGATWEEVRDRLRAPRRPITPAVLEAWLEGTDLPPRALDAVTANFTRDADGLLRLRATPEDEERLIRSLWVQDCRHLAELQAPVSVVAGSRVDAHGQAARRDSIAEGRRLLGPRWRGESWLAGGHDLPLELPEQVADAIAVAVPRNEVICA